MSSLDIGNSLVTTQWLAEHLDISDLKIVDGTYFLPVENRDADAEFLNAHIPGAVRFDIDAIKDFDSPLPHMVPSEEVFASSVGKLGISSSDTVVVYDTTGASRGPRVWWMFRVFGHQSVAVLDGGLVKWKAEGRPLATGPNSPAAITYKASKNADLVRTIDQMRLNLNSLTEQVADARPAGRFTGDDKEPRAGMRSGHIPGSLSVPVSTLFNPQTAEFKSEEELRSMFVDAGINLARPVVTTCGSGVTASSLAFALHLVGCRDIPVYDGSWTEWGGREDTPIAVGPQAAT